MRSEQVSDWLAHSDWATWARKPIAGDASARRYERLYGPKGESIILMDAPPELCGSQSTFVNIANHLRAAGLSAPEVLVHDDVMGILILSDLGHVDYATHLSAAPGEEMDLYAAAVDVLRRLAKVPLLPGLSVMTPMVGTDMLVPAFDWAADERSADLKSRIEAEFCAVLTQVAPNPSTLSLRDFHAENLIWRADMAGLDRVGLLDFQDAFITHPTYDLASLLRDARRDVVEGMLPDLLLRLDPDADQDDLKTAFHVMAVQRNVRILGIFHRLANQDGKTRYMDFVPRVKSHLIRDLSHPVMERLRPLIHRAFLKDLS